MASAKDLIVKPIKATDANRLIKKMHYSGKVVPNSQLHLGVFWQGHIEGVMSFGPPLNKKGTINIVEGTRWNGFIELNRMAFSERLPRNSESRAISIAMKLLRKNYHHIEWVISFADGCQCGDGTIYRASGFVLTDIRHSHSLRLNPATNKPMHAMQAHHLKMDSEFRTWKPLQGFQMRYLYFLNPKARERLTVPCIPFKQIAEMGASMYRRESNMREKQANVGTTDTATEHHRSSRSNLSKASTKIQDAD
jgi:hypothetical protein